MDNKVLTKKYLILRFFEGKISRVTTTMAKHWVEKRIADEQIAVGAIIAAERTDKVIVLDQNNDEYVSLVNDWKKRMRITHAFDEDYRVKSFDYRLIKYHESFCKENDVKRYLSEAIDKKVNIFCCYDDTNPNLVVKVMDQKLLNIEFYRKIYSAFGFIIVDYKNSGFNCLLNHEGEDWIIRL